MAADREETGPETPGTVELWVFETGQSIPVSAFPAHTVLHYVQLPDFQQ